MRFAPIAARPSLPRIVRILEKYETGACPHCGALGKRAVKALLEDGTTIAAMAGCIQLWPMAPIAREQMRLEQLAESAYKRDRKPSGWTTQGLRLLERFYAGEATERDTMDALKSLQWQTQAWQARRYGR